MVNTHFIAMSLISFLILNTLTKFKGRLNFFISSIPLAVYVSSNLYMGIMEIGTFIILMFICSYNILRESKFNEEVGFKLLVLISVFLIAQNISSHLTGALLIALVHIVKISNLHKLGAPIPLVKQKIGKGLIVLLMMTFIMLLPEVKYEGLIANAYLLVALFLCGVIDTDEPKEVETKSKIDEQSNELIQYFVLPYVFIQTVIQTSNTQGSEYDKVTLGAVVFGIIWFYIKSFLRNSNLTIMKRVMKINLFSIIFMSLSFGSINLGVITFALLINYFLYMLSILEMKRLSVSVTNKLTLGFFFSAPFSPILLYKLNLIISNSKILLITHSIVLIILSLLPMLAYSQMTKVSSFREVAD